MFVGHLAVGLAGKRVEPRLPLSALMAAAFGLDLLWPVLLLVGLETVRIVPGITAFSPLDFASYPWSHSLLMSLVWGAIAGHVARVVVKSVRAGVVVAAAVVSHWVLDFVTHRPDLALWPGGPRVGLSLWQSVAGTFVVEGALFAAGIVLYARATRARDAQGRWGLLAFVAVIAAVWIAQPFSPPPSSVTALAVVGLAGAVVVFFWVAWFDRHRTPRGSGS